MSAADLDAVRALAEQQAAAPAGSRLVGTRLDQVDTTRPIDWLWPGRIPRSGALTLFDGPPDVGKSTLAADIAARISTGSPWPDGSRCPIGDVVLVTSESAQQVIARQIEAAGGDRARILLVTTVGEGLAERPVALPADLPLLRPALGEAVAMILDPALEVIGDVGTDNYRDRDVRRGLTPIRRMCEELDLALIGIRHPTKGVGGTAMYKGGGSIAFVAVARAAYYIARDPADPDLRVIACTKCNLGPRPDSIAYRLEVVRDLEGVAGAENDLGVCRVEWSGVVDRTAQELADSPDSLSPEQRGVLSALIDGCTTIGEVEAYTGRSYTACSNNLIRLVKLKHARRTKTGHYEPTGTLAPPTVTPFSSLPYPPVINEKYVNRENDSSGIPGVSGIPGGDGREPGSDDDLDPWDEDEMAGRSTTS